MGKVIDLKSGVEVCTADEILTDTLGELEDALILGFNEHGQFIGKYSSMSGERALMLCRQFEKHLLDGEYD